LHKIIEGGADKSYGIHVARLAGIPSLVIQRANELLIELQNGLKHAENIDFPETSPMPLFQLNHPVLEELEKIDLNSISPLDALNKLYAWQKEIRHK